jgi:hypothetical protein
MARSFLQELAALPLHARMEALRSHVRAQLTAVLSLEDSMSIAPDLGFFEMGMSSLTALELRARLQTSLGRPLPASVALDHPTLSALTAWLAKEKLAAELSGAGGPPLEGAQSADEPHSEEAALSQLEGYSEEELGSLLDEKLSRLDALDKK